MGDFFLVDVLVLMWFLQICLLCRSRGHSLKNCPNKNDKIVDKKLCYNCGKSGHSLDKCPQPLQEGNFIFFEGFNIKYIKLRLATSILLIV